MRRLAAESIVLLKNENGFLPLQPDRLRKVAIVGGNAKATVISGGGSAMLKPSYFISPYDGIVNALPQDVDVVYREGAICTYSKSMRISILTSLQRTRRCQRLNLSL